MVTKVFCQAFSTEFAMVASQFSTKTAFFYLELQRKITIASYYSIIACKISDAMLSQSRNHQHSGLIWIKNL